MSGRVVSQKTLVAEGNDEVSWNEDLRAGVYIMRMIATPEDGQSVSREVRIIINQ